VEGFAMSANVKPLFPPDALCSVSASRGGVTLTIEGQMTVATANRLLARWAIAEGWHFREHFWEVWRPVDPRG
jgi:hypothetical protein